MSEKVFVVEITPVIDTAGTTQTFLFGTSAFATGPSDTPANTPVRPYLKNPGALRRELFSGARITGAITPSYGNIVLANVAPTEDAEGELDEWLNYGLSGSKIIVRYGEIGQPYPSGWTTVYIAYAQSFVADLNEITIRLRDRLQLFDRPVVSSGFNGSGGLEGTVSAAKKKQFVAGVVQFIPAILIDEQKQIYFVQSSSPGRFDQTDYFLVYDNGIPITKQSNYTSESTLLSTPPSEGYCRFYFGARSGYASLNGTFVPGVGVVYPPESYGVIRRAPMYNGPVYFRLGSPPAGDIRVHAIGQADDTDAARGGANPFVGIFTAGTFATRVGVLASDIDSTTFSLLVNGRYVADNSTYLDVLQDQCIARQGWFGFTRLDRFRAGVLLDPTEEPNISVYEFTQANIQNLRREPINGMEAPVWKLSVTAGQTYPSQVANGAASSVKDYLTREYWNSFQGVSETTLRQHPGAIATTLDIKGRDFSSQETILAFLDRYFLLFGGRRDFFTFTTPMTDEVLALELHDVVTLKVPRFGLSAGEPFRIVGIEINCANQRGPTVKFTLWGGQQGELTGYDGGPDARVDEPPPVNPFLLQEQMEDFSSQFFGQVRAPSDSSYIMDDFISSFIGAVTNAGSNCDPHFDKVLLLVKFDNNFVDFSSYNRTPTSTATIDNTNFKFGGGSGNYAAGQQTSYPHDTIFNFGTNDFTIECWIRPTTSDSNTRIIVQKDPSSIFTAADTTFIMYIRNGFLGWEIGYGNGNFYVSKLTNLSVSINTWSHVVLTRISTNIYSFVNGVMDSAVSIGANSVNTNTSPVIIGRDAVGGSQFLGQIDDLRITKDIARYATNFTPPVTPFPNSLCSGCDSNFDNVVLLLHMDGSNGATTFTDSSSYARAVTANGNAQISTTQSKFGGASGYFDGSGDYLSIAANDNLLLGTSNFTIEFWQYYNSLTNNQTLLSVGYTPATGVNGGWIVQTGNGNGKINFYYQGMLNATLVADESGTINTNTWYHVAIVRNGSTLTIYRNGVSVASGIDNNNYSANYDLIIGGGSSTGFNNFWFNGYLDDLRITKGIARYTADFTIPSAAYPDAPCFGFDRTMLQLHFDGLNNTTTFTDSSSYNRTVTVGNNAKISTTQSKFGGSSGYFDGVNDYIQIADSDNFWFGSQNFTIDCWIFLETLNDTASIVNQIGSTTATDQQFIIRAQTQKRIFAQFQGTNSQAYELLSANDSINTGQWYHIAIARDAGTMRLFINGSIAATCTQSTGAVSLSNVAFHNVAFPIRIGAEVLTGFATPQQDFNGYIDELRIIKGFAMFTTAFTPPTAPYSDE